MLSLTANVKDHRVGGLLRQRSPIFLAPGAGFVEDSFSMDGWGAGSGGDASGGERLMKLCSLARRSPPTVRPGS